MSKPTQEALAHLQRETDKGKLEYLQHGDISDAGIRWLFKAVDNTSALIREQDRIIDQLIDALSAYNPLLAEELRNG